MVRAERGFKSILQEADKEFVAVPVATLAPAAMVATSTGGISEGQQIIPQPPKQCKYVPQCMRSLSGNGWLLKEMQASQST
eukprot:4854238-Amphidinium_carterae.1